MDFTNYLEKFQKGADQLDKSLLTRKQMEVSVGVVLNSAFLKLYKKHWANPSQNPLMSESRIFFSIWVNKSTLQEKKIFYNIHALKLRKMKGYSIESRKFADTFRTSFKKFKSKWPNVSVDFGPLTLMEGWTNFNINNFQNKVSVLANNFFEIEHLVDSTLDKFK
ncbi:MAG: hypothetical protein GC171_02100 [Terrimonas sp.]|nr:hypothetical protein [Terrimonas sp.]